MELKASDWRRLAYTGAVAAFFVVNFALSFFLIAFGQIFPGLVAGAAVFMYCYHRSIISEKLLLNPPDIKTYVLVKHEVVKVLQDTVPNINLEDRWWRLHWKNDMKGEMKFVVNYELPSSQKGMPNVKQQIVLDAYLSSQDDNARTSVRLIFNPSSIGNAQMSAEHLHAATNLIKHTTESVDYQLRLAEQGKL